MIIYLKAAPMISDFVILKPISRGAYGYELNNLPKSISFRKVFLGTKKKDKNQLYAIKVMSKSAMCEKNLVGQGWFSFFAKHHLSHR